MLYVLDREKNLDDCQQYPLKHWLFLFVYTPLLIKSDASLMQQVVRRQHSHVLVIHPVESCLHNVSNNPGEHKNKNASQTLLFFIPFSVSEQK